MDIGALKSGSSAGYAAYGKGSHPRNLKAATALALLPRPSPSPAGLGLNLDIYDLVAKQGQGLYSGGRTAVLAANAVLGIDNSQVFSRRPPAD